MNCWRDRHRLFKFGFSVRRGSGVVCSNEFFDISKPIGWSFREARKDSKATWLYHRHHDGDERLTNADPEMVRNGNLTDDRIRRPCKMGAHGWV